MEDREEEVDHPTCDGDAASAMKRLQFKEKPKAKSHSDLSHNVHDDDDASELMCRSPRTEPSSPAKKSLAFRSGRRMQAVWASLKKLAPHKLKSRKGERSTNGLQHHSGRLSSSHPDVSSNNLAALGSVTRLSEGDAAVHGLNAVDDSALPNNVFVATGSDQEMITRQPSISEKKIHFEADMESTSLMDGELNSQRLRTLRQHVFYQLEVHLRHGKALLAKDSCGTSDPYIKFKAGNKQLHKSRTINKTLDPVWDETFTLPIEDVFQPVFFRVYDYDFAMQDDFMGAAQIDLTTLELNKSTDLELPLSETGNPADKPEKSWGSIMLTVTLIPKTQEDKEHFFTKPGSKASADNATSAKKQKTQIWESVVTITLVEGKSLLPMDENGLSDPYVKFRLGTEKYKSKNCVKTLNPQWKEIFDLHMYPDQSKILEISVWDRDFHGKDDFMGRCSIDLSTLEKETPLPIWLDLEDGAGSVHLLLSISGTMGTETISDLKNFDSNPKEREQTVSRYGLIRSFSTMKDVGHLVVKVFRAHGLASADIGGKSDPFCVLELVNARLQTHTEYKTLSPEWNKIFTFQVKDINSVLEVTIYDEDQNKKFEFLGKVAIPLLKIKNGDRRWYALKDKKLRTRAKGQVLLEMDVIWNPVRASVRTFNPKEAKYIHQDQKFKRVVFLRNLNRVKMMALDFVDVAKFLNSCFLWESPARSVTAFVVFLVITYSFELYMVPVALLLIFLKNYLVLAITGFALKEEEECENEDDDDDDDDDKDSKSEEKKSLKEKLQVVQESIAMIQNVLGDIASFGERMKNTFNFSVYFLSLVFITVLSAASVILYYVPIRYLIMLWGINKFTKKLRNPHAIPNNEIIDFLSRVPDNDEKIMFREMKVSAPLTTEPERKRKKL